MNPLGRMTGRWQAPGKSPVQQSANTQCHPPSKGPPERRLLTAEDLLLLSVSVPHRYFQCMPRYGLFAPVHKVTRIGFPCTTPTKTKSSRRRSGLERSPSASSVSSLSSTTSSISCRPSRAGLVRGCTASATTQGSI